MEIPLKIWSDNVNTGITRNCNTQSENLIVGLTLHGVKFGGKNWYLFHNQQSKMILKKCFILSKASVLLPIKCLLPLIIN